MNSLYRQPAGRGKSSTEEIDGDPVLTEVVRHALNSAANQMTTTIMRTSMSPIVYEQLDFAAAMFDRNYCLLSQGMTLPIFLGNLGLGVEAAVEALGGETELRPGDVILHNVPYETGTHAQDCAVVTPVFFEDELVGYTASRVHWADIGAQNTYCTSTIDVFQEGVIFPGVKIYKSGQPVKDMIRMVTANTRMPESVYGDLNAQVAAAHVGENALRSVIERFDLDTFRRCVRRMYDHGEAEARSFFKTIPDGRYTATGYLDNDGISDDPIEFEVVVEIDGSNVLLDYSGAPDALRGPLNCPLPTTVATGRIALAMLARAGGATPNEGHARPIEILTRPGSMFHPISPQPCYMYGWPMISAIDAIYHALSRSLEGIAPSGSAGDLCSIQLYGTNAKTRKSFFMGGALPCGSGAHSDGDGATLFVPAISRSGRASAELLEAKFPVLFKKWEFIPDSCGAGQYRGGMGWAYHWQTLQDAYINAPFERSKVPSWGQRGGKSGAPNKYVIEFPDGSVRKTAKVTGLGIPGGTFVSISCGGGGGYGDPLKRDSQMVFSDLEDGLITHEFAREHYPHVLRGDLSNVTPTEMGPDSAQAD